MTIALQSNVSLQDWWASLKHGGLLIASSKLSEFFVAESLSPLPRFIEDRLRRDVTRLQNGEDDHLSTFLDTVLEEVLGLAGDWQKGSQVDRTWSYPAITREMIRPRRVWQGVHGEVLPVFVADGQESGGKVTRLGIGRGKRSVSRVVEWLRKANQKIALLTNGYQWRLIHAGADYDAWCEWDVTFWFEEGQPGSQVTALRLLLGQQALQTDRTDVPSPLLVAIAASRQGQAELSEVLGERVRQAVELLIRESAEALAPLMAKSDGIEPRHVYIAATRIVMRCVVILFAEARDLLPRDNPIYHSAYGLQGLREQLDRRAGGRAAERLRQGVSSWSRLLALFKLVYEGCAHEALPVPQYGGGLFEPGNSAANDPILRALSAFENPSHTPSDAVVYRILELLCRSKVKVRQGRRSTWVEAPVDFSDLSSEYIGILYEGLLDFELRQATADEPMVFLNLGDQPVLPLARLEGMDDKTLSALVEKLKQKAKAEVEGEGEEGEDAEGDEAEPEESEELDAEADTEPEAELDVAIAEDVDQLQQLRDRAQQWAVRAVKAGNLVPKPRSKKADAQVAYERAVGKAAGALIARVVLPGEWFLVRWGGTRKGSGTFYTRPQLAIPTVQRTLLPLAYNPPLDEAGQPDEKAPASAWTPKTPIEILNLKICDPACGSASFLLAALRFLLEALWRSLFYHGWLVERGEEIVVSIPLDAQPEWFAECVKELPVTVEKAEERSKPRLKRFIVERCLYGVDINPLAVELARLALWVETMDKYLPFGFLDHKIKCGNALVGCWFDRFQDYPAMAWEREGGDANHDHFVHHFREHVATRGKSKGQRLQSGDSWTQAIKDTKETVKAELVNLIKAFDPEWRQQQQLSAPDFDLPKPPEEIHQDAVNIFEELHQLAIADTQEQERRYREKIEQSQELRQLRQAFDSWCAIWFWSGDATEHAPTPGKFFNQPPETAAIVNQLAQEYRFFHWELEFPDVFVGENAGFSGIVGNPPWEIQKPNSKEFFSNIDPLYRTYGKQEALEKQLEYFKKSPQVEQEWLAYCAKLKALSNWTKYAGYPFGVKEAGEFHFSLSRGKENAILHQDWLAQQQKRSGYADPDHPFRYQGSADINTYKMFLELSLAILQPKGYLGMIMPSGVYTDKGTLDLRNQFISKCKWEWLFGIINWNKIFTSIYYRFKFCILIIQKSGKTSEIKTAFSRYAIEDWENAEQFILPYPVKWVKQFSPQSLSILEVTSINQLEVIKTAHSRNPTFYESRNKGWSIEYGREFHMTDDAKLFPLLEKWEAKQFSPNNEGFYWESADGEIAFPLYEGRMIQNFDYCNQGWISGRGRRAVWQEIEMAQKRFKPQYLMSRETFYNSGKAKLGPKLGIVKVSSATNARSMKCALIPGFPCGESVYTLQTSPNTISRLLLLQSVFSTLSFDFLLRSRFGGVNISAYLLSECPILQLPNLSLPNIRFLIRSAARLSFLSPIFSSYALQLREELDSEVSVIPYSSSTAFTYHERLRLKCNVDAVVAYMYGLEIEHMECILANCDYPAGKVDSNENLDPKGFWRVDKEKDPELRHTILSLIAFHELKKIGLEAFLNLNDGEGWMLPETLRLADYELGHDDRAKEHQPVAARLGDRFLPWQLDGTPEESWAECERHAENLRQLLKYPQQTAPSVSHSTESIETAIEPVPPADPNFQQPTDLFGNPLQVDLFGNVVDTPKRRRRS
ncbi:MAG: hypothetical protein KME13_16040 [Myxacorys californica WJT36-NPBG1]|jgi:hypothetical protein|nr:hypothetical protein [Myxacorys californica WJT36-NPBG1]